MTALAPPVAELCRVLGAIGGVEAVTIGGSRAAGTADESSDWDIGLYYRGRPDWTALARYGDVYPPGSWTGS
jgi:predicted nucleotidyltransferase